tara:strand:- start:1091 stop:1381 length:291 start_codon:yes stop_codon:yes gene_type:complete
MSNQEQIKDTLNIIKKALEDDESENLDSNENILLLNNLVKEDGTIEFINNDDIKNEEIKEILDKNISKYFQENFDKWLDKNIPKYLDKYLKDKNNK